jgi:hypothetical protein
VWDLANRAKNGTDNMYTYRSMSYLFYARRGLGKIGKGRGGGAAQNTRFKDDLI